MRLVLTCLFFTALAGAQTVGEELAAMRVNPVLVRAPMPFDLELHTPLESIPSEQNAGMTTTDLHSLHSIATLAIWRPVALDIPAAAPATRPVTALPPAPEFRATVTFSPGLSVGKGVYSWEATACSRNDAVALDAGDIKQAANRRGIATVPYSEALSANKLARSRNKAVIAGEAAHGASDMGLALLAMHIVAASTPWGAGILFGGRVANQLVGFFAGQAPDDLNTRESASTVLIDEATIDLAARSEPHHCATRIIFSKTKKGAAPTGDEPIP